MKQANQVIDLWLDVIDRAYMDLEVDTILTDNNKNQRNGKVRLKIKNKESSYRWFMSDSFEDFNSFRNLCLILGLDYRYYRALAREKLNVKGLDEESWV